jgi:thiamine-monophosphate kinase
LSRASTTPVSGAAGPSLGPGAEFDRIRAYLAGLAPAEGVRVGPGDDAAVLDDGTVLSTDLAIEGIHFRLDWIRPEEAGWRAAAASLSDLAAMAAAPAGILVSLALPGPGAEGEEGGDPGRELMAGARAMAAEAGAPLLGGDLSRSPGPVVMDVVAVGRTSRPLLRSGGRPDDELWVTGRLGAAAAAVRIWTAGGRPPPALREAFARPRPRIAEARWLVEEGGAVAGIDLSDGLAGDAGHLAAASGVRAVLEEAQIPLHPSAGPGLEGRELALRGGDDFELLVAAPRGLLEPRVEEFRRRFDLSLTRVGGLSAGEGVWLLGPGGEGPVPVERGGWDHFRAEG